MPTYYLTKFAENCMKMKKMGPEPVVLLEWFRMKQTKMYVCTLEEFILVDLDTLLHKVEVNIIGKM